MLFNNTCFLRGNMKTHEINMTSGPLAKELWFFSLPLMCSNVLQVLFNLADVAVVGRFVGAVALGAVGSTTLIITLTTGIMMGLAAGVNAVAALFLGARDPRSVSRCVSTAFMICAAAGILILSAGLLFAEPVLRLIGTKDELIGGAELYLKIYLLGSPGLALYNFGNAVLSAVGDTKRPLFYLTFAGVLNVALNLLLVLVFRLGVAGVALASIISQYLSAFLILHFLLTCGQAYGLQPRAPVFDSRTAVRILYIGIPAAVQYSLFAIANLFIQSAVNSFDHIVVEGNSAAANADNIVYDIMAAFYTACTSFISQNRGAGNIKRVRDTYLLTLLYSALAAVLLGGLLALFRRQFLRLFTDDEQVLYYGSIRLGIMGCSYFISAFMDDSAAAARGLGKSIMPTLIVIMGTVVYRILWVCTVFAHFHTLVSLYLVYATAWAFTSVLGNLYLHRAYREEKRKCLYKQR